MPNNATCFVFFLFLFFFFTGTKTAARDEQGSEETSVRSQLFGFMLGESESLVPRQLKRASLMVGLPKYLGFCVFFHLPTG